jgi:hypothetical protein
VSDVNEQIDRLIHDAQHAVSGAVFAAQIGHVVPADELHQKARRLKAEAKKLYLDNPDALWPDPEDCEWPAPVRSAAPQKKEE